MENFKCWWLKHFKKLINIKDKSKIWWWHENIAC